MGRLEVKVTNKVPGRAGSVSHRRIFRGQFLGKTASFKRAGVEERDGIDGRDHRHAGPWGW